MKQANDRFWYYHWLARKHKARVGQAVAKQIFSRRAIYAGAAVIIVVLSLCLGLALNKTSDQRAVLYQRQVRLEKLNQDLQQVKELKAGTEAQIKLKGLKEAEMRREIKKLKADLQAKKAAEAQLAVAAPVVPSGGIGGNFTAPAPVASTAGNTYTYGYCTWYVKNRRPSIPNGWGDAYQWLGNARAQGFATGSTPRVGAVGTAGNHVVYVESVSGSSVFISEMNYVGWNVRSTRTAPASSFMYIY